MRKICVFVGSRANYSSLKSIMREIKLHPDLKLQTILGASAVLDRFGNLENLIKKDGFQPDYKFHNLAKSTGLGLMDATVIFDKLKPDFLVVIGDRFEMMSVTIAAAYMNIRIAHTMGGEVTGTIDESIRHAITKFAHIHFPANEDARKRIIKMGEDKKYVFNVGCPRIDSIAEELKKDSRKVLKNIFNTYGGVGEKFNLNKPYLLVSQHPVTTEYGENRFQIEQTLKALNELKMPVIMLWPNADAGGDDISKGIRTFREKVNPKWLYLFKNLPINVYIHLMKTTSCLIGNSSSGLRDGAYIGTPVVNIGTRENNRLSSKNVINVKYNFKEILKVIKQQIRHGKYKSSNLYGNGNAGKKIAEILSKSQPSVQKKIFY